MIKVGLLKIYGCLGLRVEGWFLDDDLSSWSKPSYLHEHGATAKPFPGYEKAFKLVKHPQLMGFFTRMNHSHCEFGGSIQLILRVVLLIRLARSQGAHCPFMMGDLNLNHQFVDELGIKKITASSLRVMHGRKLSNVFHSMLLSTNESWLKLLIAEILHHLIPHFYSVLSKQSHLGAPGFRPINKMWVSPSSNFPGPPSADNTAATVAGPKSSSIESAVCSTVAIQSQVWKRPWQHGKGAEKGTRPWTWLGWFELVGLCRLCFMILFPSVSSLATSQVVSSIEATL